MRLVPKQLRRKNFPGSVPYYGGRLTPQFITGLGQQAAATPPHSAELRAQLTGALQFLAAHSVMTEQEHDAIAARIAGGA